MLSLPESLFYVGVDWAAETHAVCVLDATGTVHAQFTITHTADGFADLLLRLGKLSTDPMDLPVAIERPDGRLVDALLEAGYPVVPVSSNAIKAWRDGEVLSGAKSDAGDAAIIAEYLRLRAHRLRPATPFTPETKALRTVVRTREDIVQMRVAATNPLAALLDAHWPGARAIFADIESQIALEFLTRYPTAAHATRLGEKRLRAFCVKHGYSGRRTAAELLHRLRAAPAGTTNEAVVEAIRDAVLALVTVLKAVGAARKDLDRSVAAHLGEHPDAAIFTSLPRSGQINAAQMLAEWGDSRAAYDGPDAVAALAGMTPVTSQSGKHKAVHFRWACNKHFRNAMTIFADNSDTPAPGPPTSTSKPSPAATTTHTPSASSPAPGSASSTAAGSTAPPTSPNDTATRHNSTSHSPPEVDTEGVIAAPRADTSLVLDGRRRYQPRARHSAR